MAGRSRLIAGLTGRLAVGASVAALIVVLIFALLAGAISNLRGQTGERRDSQRVTVAANALQKSVLDLETGARAFVITRQERFLEPWRQARGRLSREQHRLRTRVASSNRDNADDGALARQIGERVDRYFYDHSLPLVDLVRSRRLPPRVASRAVAEGKQRVDHLRALFSRLLSSQAARTAQRNADADRAGHRAVAVGVGGLLLILGVLASGVVYLAVAVTRPVVRVAEAATALANGRFDAKTRVSSANSREAAEVQALTESFDAMAQIVRQQHERLQAHNALLGRRVDERTADLAKARYEALSMLAVAAEHRDEDTHQHTQRVGRNAALVAEQMGLSGESTELIAAAAPLHDVGKIGISDTILLKPGRLTPEEFDVMKQHVKIGASILGASPEPMFHIAAQIALHHHERWDGSGYLSGLAGNAIPLAARIVAVIDVFDALTHARPYKDPWPLDRALDEIHRLAGSHFDPDVVAAFEAIDPDRLLADVFSDEALHEQVSAHRSP